MSYSTLNSVLEDLRKEETHRLEIFGDATTVLLERYETLAKQLDADARDKRVGNKMKSCWTIRRLLDDTLRSIRQDAVPAPEDLPFLISPRRETGGKSSLEEYLGLNGAKDSKRKNLAKSDGKEDNKKKKKKGSSKKQRDRKKGEGSKRKRSLGSTKGRDKGKDKEQRNSDESRQPTFDDPLERQVAASSTVYLKRMSRNDRKNNKKENQIQHPSSNGDDDVSSSNSSSGISDNDNNQREPSAEIEMDPEQVFTLHEQLGIGYVLSPPPSLFFFSSAFFPSRLPLLFSFSSP